MWLTHSPWLLTLTRFHSVGTRLQLLPISPLTCMVFFGFTLLLSLVNMWCYIVGLLIRISNKKSRETQEVTLGTYPCFFISSTAELNQSLSIFYFFLFSAYSIDASTSPPHVQNYRSKSGWHFQVTVFSLFPNSITFNTYTRNSPAPAFSLTSRFQYASLPWFQGLPVGEMVE